jgi:hypothetical protein
MLLLLFETETNEDKTPTEVYQTRLNFNEFFRLQISLETENKDKFFRIIGSAQAQIPLNLWLSLALFFISPPTHPDRKSTNCQAQPKVQLQLC